MQVKNNEARYGLVAKFFHWAIFIMVLFLLLYEPLSALIEGISHSHDHDHDHDHSGGFSLIWLHQSIGLSVLGLMTLRMLWRFFNSTPSYPATMLGWQKRLSFAVHWFLYIALLLQPIAGALMVRASGRDALFFNLRIPGFAVPNETLRDIAWFIHTELLSKAIIAFVAVHILAALYHHLIVKDNILKRMTWGT